MDSLYITSQDFGPKNILSNLMDQIDTASQVNVLFMHFTLYFFYRKLSQEKGFDLRPGHKGEVESVCSLATGINIDSTHLTHKPAKHKGK